MRKKRRQVKEVNIQRIWQRAYGNNVHPKLVVEDNPVMAAFEKNRRVGGGADENSIHQEG